MTLADDLATLRGLITDHSPDGYDQVDLGWTYGLRRHGLEALARVEAEIARLERGDFEMRALEAEDEVARLRDGLLELRHDMKARSSSQGMDGEPRALGRGGDRAQDRRPPGQGRCGVSGVAPACDHTWTLFCQGCWGRPWLRPYWRVDICVKCYAKREVGP